MKIIGPLLPWSDQDEPGPLSEIGGFDPRTVSIDLPSFTASADNCLIRTYRECPSIVRAMCNDA